VDTWTKVILIATAVGFVLYLLSQRLRNRTVDLKEIENDVGQKMEMFRVFAAAYRKVCDIGTLGAYKELNAASRDLLLTAGDNSRELLEKIISMTERSSVRSINKSELQETCKACATALNKDLYQKPVKAKKHKKT
jgi:hypothetical protein